MILFLRALAYAAVIGYVRALSQEVTRERLARQADAARARTRPARGPRKAAGPRIAAAARTARKA